MPTTKGQYLTRNAGADLSAKLHYLAKTNASGQFILASAATDLIIGVIDLPAKQNDSAVVETVNGSGTSKVIAGGTIAKDAPLTSDANGKAVTAVAATAGVVPTTRVFGRALTSAVAGDVFEFVKMNQII